ncbi:hypothetical protein WJX77_008574 [Trebouxia sp. C0004]
MSSLRTVPLLLVSVFGILHFFNGAIAYSAHEPHLPQSLSGVPQSVVSLITRFWDIFGPGGKFHPTAFIESKGHLVLEGLLVLVILYLFLQKSFNPSFQKQLQTELTEQEIEDLCNDWQPELLFKAATDNQPDYDPPVISGPPTTYIVANGKKVLNMVSANFLGFAGDKAIEEACAATINKYGVGSCGPRGFYGTIDVHLHLEEHLAKFMQTQETIIYAYDLATVPSILPAFANAKDIIICDEAACFAIQNGAVLSRAQVKYFKHNDVVDLKRILEEQAAKDKRSKLRLNRRFIVVEGISQNLGDIAPLDQIFKLKEKFKYRLVLDESLSFGVLGPTGRGAAEHFGLMPGQVEIVAASMGNSLASIGGFCAGDRDIVDHQRLSGLGYCFSASLPPYLATGAICALQRMQEQPELVFRVAQNARRMRELLQHIAGLSVYGGPNDNVSPVIHVQLEQPLETIWQGKALLQRVVDDAFENEGVLFTVHRLSDLDKAYSQTPASICIAITAQHSQADMQKAANALQKAYSRCLASI